MESKLNIAVIVSTYPPYAGGMGNSAADAVAVLRAAGHTIRVFTLQPAGNDLHAHEKEVERLVPRLSFGFKNGGFVPQLYAALKSGAFDVIYLHYPFYGGAEMVWLYKLLHPKTRLIIQFHMDTPKLSWKGKVLTLPSVLIRKRLFKRAETVICSTLDYAKHSSIGSYVERWPEKFVEVPFGVDLTRFHVLPFDVPVLNELRERYGIREKEKVVMFLGGLDRAHAFKGVDVLLQAMAEVIQRSTVTVRCLICGSGDLRSEYERQARELGIEKNVIFAGRVSDEEMTLHYNLADVFVLPSTDSSEAFGIVLLQAMACGIPVIASDLPGVRAVFENGISGYAVETGSVAGLADKLRDYFRHPGRRWKMGKAARERVEERFDREAVEEKLKGVFG